MTAAEIKAGLSKSSVLSVEDVEAVLGAHDVNGDSLLTVGEFIELFKECFM